MEVIVKNDISQYKQKTFDIYSHCKDVMQQISELRLKSLLFDVQINVNGHIFKAHKLILSACSEYFRAMFTGTLTSGTRTTEIVINHISALGVEKILNFIYTAKLEINLSNVQEILAAANYFQLNSVIDACLVFLESELDVENCVDILIISENYSLCPLEKRTLKFICSQINVIAKTVDFNRLLPRQIENILSHDFPVDCSEANILRIVVVWIQNYEEKIKTDKKTTNGDLDYWRLLKHIRFDLISVNELEKVLKQVQINRANPFFNIIWNMAVMRTQSLSDGISDSGLINYRGMEKAIIKIGGFQLNGITNCIEYCFPVISSKSSSDNSGVPSIPESWRALTDVPHIKQASFGTAVLANCIYVVGGSYDINLEEYDTHPFGFRYCPLSSKWTTIKPMNQDRCRFSLNVVDSCLIAVGSGHTEWNGSNNVSTAERYNPVTDEWTYIANFPEHRSQHAGAALEKNLYISGGIDSYGNVSNSFYCYNVTENTWLKMANLTTPRADHVMTISDRKLYFIGGWNEVNSQRQLVEEIDIYDLDTNSFKSITKIPTPRFHCGVTMLGDNIYIIGGFATDDIFRHTAKIIEVYNVQSKKWHKLERYPKNIWEHYLETIYIPKHRTDKLVIDI